MKISVVIPNWNGLELLKKNLPAVLAAKPDEIIVVDDASPDASDDFLTKNYPQVKIVRHKTNLGFGAGCNDGVKECRNELVALLNLDVIPEENAFEKIIGNFDDEKVFAVSFNEPNYSWAKIFWENGYFEHEVGEKSNEVHISGWASGGSAVFRKTIWEELGGFDELYRPFYWEDLDIGYRAWKRGYKVLWDPKAIVYHKHESVIGRHFSKDYINFISERNRLIFIWKNITDNEMVKENIKALVPRLRHPGYIKVILAALLKLPSIVSGRSREKELMKIPDKDIFKLFEEA